jgi:hydroxymethylpyrimidine pyrophosphatase-like HAD family hydrolase
VTDASLVQTCRARAASHGFNVVYSRGRYLDVLPVGVDKGRALLAVIDYFGIAPGRVLACGDTLNDLSLFHTGLCAVAVGGSELALLEATRGCANVLHARLFGAAGITEAISHFFEPLTGDARS